jgi:CSLREA domain-containing protein
MRSSSLAVLGFSLTTFAHAATIHVTTPSDQIADTGTCSLREAIIAEYNAPQELATGCPSGIPVRRTCPVAGGNLCTLATAATTPRSG